MYSHPFRYYRAGSLKEAVTLLSELGAEARPLAGGQSLIPLMKLRLSRPSALVDLNHIPGISQIEQSGGAIHFGALARHADIEDSDIAAAIPIIHDCAAGIADVQVRNQGTIGGSLAEADPSGDWPAALRTLETMVRCFGPKGERAIPLEDLITDAYTTVLEHEELVTGISVKLPPANSGGAYVAFKRSAPVYPTASVGAQLTLAEKNVCKDARIVLGCVGLGAIRASAAEAELLGKSVTPERIKASAEAAMAAAEPQADIRGSIEYKRTLVGALVKRALVIAMRRAHGERVEAGHEYVG